MRRFRASQKHLNLFTVGNSMRTHCAARGPTRGAASQVTGDDAGWFPWSATPPDPDGEAVEVRCDGWQHSRLWRPSGPPPENARGLVWRHGDDRLRLLAKFGGIYAPGDQPLHGSPPLVVDPSDWNGPWAVLRIIHPMPRPRLLLAAMASAAARQIGAGATYRSRRTGVGPGLRGIGRDAWARCFAPPGVRGLGGRDGGRRQCVTR